MEPAVKLACGEGGLEGLRGALAVAGLGLQLQRVGAGTDAGDGLEQDVLEVGLADGGADVGDVDRLRVGHGQRVAALEVDAEERVALEGHARGTTADDDERDDEADVAQAEEVEARRLDELEHLQLRLLGRPENPVEDVAGDDERGEEIGDDAEHEGDGEATQRAGAEVGEHDGGDERGDVGVEDGAEGLLEAGVDGEAGGLAQRELVANALIDEHVGVDGHADGEHDAGDAGQREGEVELREEAEEKDEIHRQRDHGRSCRRAGSSRS